MTSALLGGEGSKIEGKVMTESNEKMLTWGRGLSKIVKKSADVFYGRPLCELCCWANIANLSTAAAAGFENAPKT